MNRNNEMILSMRRADTVLSENVAVIGSKNKTSLMDLKRLSEIVAQKKNTSILVPSARRFDVLFLSLVFRKLSDYIQKNWKQYKFNDPLQYFPAFRF